MTAWPRFFALVLSAVPAIALAATMYKWVDADGHTHYTQEPPPPGIQGQEVKPPPKVDTSAAQAESEAFEKSVDATLEKRATEQKSENEEADYQTKKKQKCEQARQRLEKTQRPLTNFVDKDGTQRRATEEERQQQMKDSEKQVTEFCG